MVLTNEQDKNERAIGRAHAGEPVSLLIFADNGSTALVIGEQEQPPWPIGYKKEWLYEFSAGLFGKLRKAWERRDTDELTRLWANAPRFGN
jgi:hypothetical protein